MESFVQPNETSSILLQFHFGGSSLFILRKNRLLFYICFFFVTHKPVLAPNAPKLQKVGHTTVLGYIKVNLGILDIQHHSVEGNIVFFSNKDIDIFLLQLILGTGRTIYPR